MNQVRKLQYMGNQFFLNVPADMAKYFNLQKGDYFELAIGGNNNFMVRKIANNTEQSEEVKLRNMKDEAYMLSMTINAIGSTFGPGEFSGRLAQLTNLQGRIRKLEKKLNPQI